MAIKQYIVDTANTEYVFGIHDYNWSTKDSTKFDKDFQTITICLKKNEDMYEVLCVDYVKDLITELIQEPVWRQLEETDKVLILLYSKMNLLPMMS